MAYYSTYSSLMCFCMFVSCMLGVYGQLFPKEAEAVRSGKQLNEITTEAVPSTTAEMIATMRRNKAMGTTPARCGPRMNCAFIIYNENKEYRLEDIVRYCPEGCVDGYSCELMTDDTSQRMYIFYCKEIATSTTPAETTTATSENVQRRSGPDAHADEL